MAHDHHHHHGSSYFMEQLFTIGCCGLVGGIAVLLYTQGTVEKILAPQFAKPLLFAGIALLVLVAIRAINVWQLAGKVGKEHHHHDHDHAPCDHDHGDCDHEHHHHHEPKAQQITTKPALMSLNLVSATEPPAHTHEHHGHDHDHAHGWVPVRYLVLLIVVLFWYFIPAEGLVAQYKAPDVDTSSLKDVKRKNLPLLRDLSFVELERAAYSEDSRIELEGREATIIGQFVPIQGDDKRFGLVRYKINCCAADAIPFNSLVMIDPDWKGARLNMDERKGKWVEVRARIAFVKKRNTLTDEYVTALIVEPTDKKSPNELIEILKEAPRNPYVQ